MNLIAGEPPLQLLPHRGGRALNQHGHVVQARGELAFEPRFELRRAKEAHRGAAQRVVERLDTDAPGHGLIRNHQIKTVQRQLGQQVRELAFAANQPHRLSQIQGRLQQAIGD